MKITPVLAASAVLLLSGLAPGTAPGVAHAQAGYYYNGTNLSISLTGVPRSSRRASRRSSRKKKHRTTRRQRTRRTSARRSNR